MGAELINADGRTDGADKPTRVLHYYWDVLRNYFVTIIFYTVKKTRERSHVWYKADLLRCE